MEHDCLFCRLVRGEIPSDKLYEDSDLVAFRDIEPQAPLHVLVIPKKHLRGPEAVAEEDEALIGKLMRIGNRIALEQGFPHYRVVLNNGEQVGQSVFHLHMHILAGRRFAWPPG